MTVESQKDKAERLAAEKAEDKREEEKIQREEDAEEAARLNAASGDIREKTDAEKITEPNEPTAPNPPDPLDPPRGEILGAHLLQTPPVSQLQRAIPPGSVPSLEKLEDIKVPTNNREFHQLSSIQIRQLHAAGKIQLSDVPLNHAYYTER